MGASRHPVGEIRVKFFDYFSSKEYYLHPYIVEYDTNVMIKPGFDLILGSKTIEKLGIVLDFLTK